MKDTFYIIDFDSTFVTTESLDELASIVLKGRSDKTAMVNRIKKITDQGMTGIIPFEDGLRKRLKLIRPDRTHLKKLIRLLRKKISPSIVRHKSFFQEFADRIYIVSGGFREFVSPIVSSFGIADDHVLANSFIFDQLGHITGYDQANVLSKKDGKIAAVKALQLKGDIVAIGDGYSDYQLRALGVAKHFIAFTENVTRQTILSSADYVAASFDEILYHHKMPMAISYPKSRIQVLLLENIHESAIRIFEKEGYLVEYHQEALDQEILKKKIQSTHILGIRSRTKVRKDLLQAAERLLAIGTYCIGTEQIDLTCAAERGVAVFNAPYSNTRSVVELAIADLLSLARATSDKSTKMHQGIWDKSSDGCVEIRGKTIGIIGYGNIGSQLAVLAEALGMRVCFYDIVEKLALGNAVRCRSLQELLKKSDFVSLHVDGRPGNQNLISDRQFHLMRPGAIFLNLSRGSVVDIHALKKHLASGHLRGAALDVYPEEPKNNDEMFESELRGLPNTILTPHIGGSTIEAQQNIADFVCRETISYINSGSTQMSVNIPPIQLSILKKAHRLLHLHRNTPGILAQINGILASYNINILGQYLKTNETVGYVITDVDKRYNTRVIDELKNIPHTIRFRILY
ncbi:3-phosphoglycerate dehydrogenase [Candidatus Wirthbacteria bacterium CG2_30_54_11]|uniref:D-3-phosphoglycerate dehydrogenase n=1 Tax=Candidatus Wirthbacteria bacterium CG2_30_54_11 TaxID=1817892 RepID=A0A1J5IYV9_9BACT|nr:MAG: 3-phosphoglycerate dehydrogenase [Candidatus Wirthbacteria bacterium CG2_30_54_11]